MSEACKLSIVSAVDGRETVFQRDGQGEFSFLKTALYYNDGAADVFIEADKSGVTIRRTGDYSMELFLKEGEKTKGSLGILGHSGGVEVFAEKLGYSSTETSFMLFASYSLIFGSDTQKMKIRLTAKRSNEGIK